MIMLNDFGAEPAAIAGGFGIAAMAIVGWSSLVIVAARPR